MFGETYLSFYVRVNLSAFVHYTHPFTRSKHVVNNFTQVCTLKKNGNVNSNFTNFQGPPFIEIM